MQLLKESNNPTWTSSRSWSDHMWVQYSTRGVVLTTILDFIDSYIWWVANPRGFKRQNSNMSYFVTQQHLYLKHYSLPQVPWFCWSWASGDRHYSMWSSSLSVPANMSMLCGRIQLWCNDSRFPNVSPLLPAGMCLDCDITSSCTNLNPFSFWGV